MRAFSRGVGMFALCLVMWPAMNWLIGVPSLTVKTFGMILIVSVGYVFGYLDAEREAAAKTRASVSGRSA